MKVGSLLLLAAMSGAAALAAVEHPERYVQSRSGEIQILPALTLEEIPRGKVSGVESAGGFVFDIEWRENKMTKMRVHSPSGGVCRIRSYAGIGSPLMRKAKGECPNPAVAATKGASTDALPESCFERKRNPLSSVCFDFDTEPGETLEFRGVSGNQDWTGYSSKLSDAFLATPEAARVAQNVLDWQLDTGGWPKNVPMHEKLSPKERKAVLALKGDRKRGTIDNGATFTEIRFLARMYKATGGREYLDGALKGIGFLLYLQYPNGGWPQCDPAKVGYWHQITYNDGSMLNVMKTMRDVYESNSPFDIPIPQEMRDACKKGFRNGLVCILKTQIVQNGKLTLWCQQHDRETLEPCVGRSFELPAICTLESGDLVLFLMGLDLDEYSVDTADKIRSSIEGAVEWYRANGLKGYKIENGWRRDDGIKTGRLVRTDDKDAPTLWCRYYTLEDNRPFTGRRDGTKNFDFSEMERGENMSYMWFNTRGAQVERAYAKWLRKNAKKANKRAAADNALACPLDCAALMLESEMKRSPVPCDIDKRKKPKWEYTDGLELQAALAVAARRPELRERTLLWAQDYIDRMVTKDGEILGYRKEDCKLDCINPGKFAFDMYELAVERGDEAESARLRKVLDEQFAQFAIQPRVAEGGFWHKKVYPHQMWLDGLYMGCPYYARYAAMFLTGDERGKAFDDIAKQFAVVTRHTYDAKTGLYRHGWDEAKEQVWADKETGQSAHAWGRALGWFAAAIVDTLEYFPKDHPSRESLLKLLSEYSRSLIRWQDASGAWWQVADQPAREGNYLEATATALIGYAMVKAWNRGYVGEDVRDAGLKAYEALNRDFIRKDADGTVSLTRCCAVAGLSADRDGSFEYYLREPIRDNDAKGVGPYMLLALEMHRRAN